MDNDLDSDVGVSDVMQDFPLPLGVRAWGMDRGINADDYFEIGVLFGKFPSEVRALSENELFYILWQMTRTKPEPEPESKKKPFVAKGV